MNKEKKKRNKTSKNLTGFNSDLILNNKLMCYILFFFEMATLNFIKEKRGNTNSQTTNGQEPKARYRRTIPENPPR